MYPILPHNSLEHAMLRCHAQMLASNDFLRALAQNKWEGSVCLQSPLLASANSIHPWLATNAFNSYQHFFYHANSDRGSRSTSIPEESLNEIRKSTTQTQFSNPPPISVSSSFIDSSSPLNEEKRGSPVFFSKSSSPKISLPTCERAMPASSVTPSQQDVHSPASSNSLSPASDVVECTRKRKRSKRMEVRPVEKDSYPCSICGASYPHKFELNRHIKVSHVRPHRCNQCGKGFGHRNYLKVHIETVHLGQKSHQCRLCGKYLSTGGNLNVHVRTIHFGEKKYNCPICNRSFGQQCNMKTHMKRHYSKSDD